MKASPSMEQYIATHQKSKELYEKALGVIPRGVTHDGRYLQPFPIYIARAQGSRKWDVDGNEYIDYFGGHGALMLGHCHPSFVQAVTEQLARVGSHLGACHELEIEWANQIIKMVPCAERVEFTSSGTEANMMALRLARAFTGRAKIIKFREHFGGWHDHLMVGDIPPYDRPSTAGTLPADWASTIVLPCNNEAILERTLATRDAAALLVEAGGAHTGAVGIAPSFYAAMRRLTKEYGTLLVFDEVITGFRYAPGGIQEYVGVTPDMATLGKCVAGGMPGAGAVVGRADILSLLDFTADAEWNRWRRIRHPGTFNANPLGAAAGLTMLKILATGEPQKRVHAATRRLRQGVEAVLGEKGVEGCAYGRGGAFHIYFGPCERRAECDREVCLNEEKRLRPPFGTALRRNTLLNGIDVPEGARGYISAVHNDEDLDQTVKVYATSLDILKQEGDI